MNKANIFMAAGWVGLAGIAIYVAGSLLFEAVAIPVAGASIAVFSCWAMLFTRNADEYTRGLWTSAASLAFATLLILFLALPFFEGVYDGFTAAHEGIDREDVKQDISAMVSISLAIGAFYIGLFWKRIRGG